jgi:hypothetical protein
MYEAWADCRRHPHRGRTGRRPVRGGGMPGGDEGALGGGLASGGRKPGGGRGSSGFLEAL